MKIPVTTGLMKKSHLELLLFTRLAGSGLVLATLNYIVRHLGSWGLARSGG